MAWGADGPEPGLAWGRVDDQDWKTTRRILGVAGFVYLLAVEGLTDVQLPLPLYGVIAGLLGLDYVLDLRR